MSDPAKRGTPALYVGLVGDAPRTPPARVSLAALDRIDIGRGETRKIDRRTDNGVALASLALADPRMSTQHARLARIGTTWIAEDLGSKNGTWIASSRITKKPLADGDVMIVGHTVLVFRAHGGEEPDLLGEPPAIAPGLVTLSPVLAGRYRELAAAAPSITPIAILGEPGTGKELAATAVHALSGRGGKLVAVNCGAVPGPQLESELFGGDDGAGHLRGAAGGTLFLDEVDELPDTAQARLLGVLQGETDVRVIVAMRRELDADIESGDFRADLRDRLTGVTVQLTPLRQRREDLGMLVGALLARLAPDRTIAFSADAMVALYAHDWPLNNFELERALSAALAVATDRIEVNHLPAAVGETEPIQPSVFREIAPEERALREQLVAAIQRNKGNLAAVARDMGKDRTQIRRWMKRFGIVREVTE